jgi:phenylacetic acid degradation operon negative regulatory protein
VEQDGNAGRARGALVSVPSGRARGDRDAAAEVLAGERPLTARSVIASTLLGADPPELPVAHLLHVAGLFGVNENRARVALSRMVASGEARSDGPGRYRLAGHLLERHKRQLASRVGRTAPWSGDWQVVVLAGVAAGADVRGRRRRALRLNRLAELRQGVWLRPDNLPPTLAPGLSGAPGSGEPGSGEPGGAAGGDGALGDGAERFSARPRGDPSALARRLWDLEAWASRARALLEALEALVPSGPEVLAPGFVLSAAVLRHFQADPLLPDALLPASWPGTELRARYDEWDAAYRAVLVEWGSAPAGAGGG